MLRLAVRHQRQASNSRYAPGVMIAAVHLDDGRGRGPQGNRVSPTPLSKEDGAMSFELSSLLFFYGIRDCSKFSFLDVNYCFTLTRTANYGNAQQTR